MCGMYEKFRDACAFVSLSLLLAIVMEMTDCADFLPPWMPVQLRIVLCVLRNVTSVVIWHYWKMGASLFPRKRRKGALRRRSGNATLLHDSYLYLQHEFTQTLFRRAGSRL